MCIKGGVMGHLHPQAASAKLYVELSGVLSLYLEDFEIIRAFSQKGLTASPSQISGYATATTD